MQGIEADEEKKIIYDAVASLVPREREIIEMRFGLHGGKEMTQKEVADALGISQSYISRLEKRILAHLKEEIQDKL
jgi:RNA polymerase sporulation-specific sigma factor